MSKHLVIVESPAKGKTIEKYLGKDYQVLASYGHVRDLPKSKLGVDVEHDFAPDYVVPTKAKKAVTSLKKAMSSVDDVYLATDYDREGEAIAWHVAQALGLGNSKLKIENLQLPVHRITFHEITKSAIEEAVKHPRELDMDLINAQQARRVLDRLVGYTLSPFLWKKVMKGLSAGRVQSVAARMIVEREGEIRAFTADEYWSIDARLASGRDSESRRALLKKDAEELTASLVQFEGKGIEKLTVTTAEQAAGIKSALDGATYTVTSIEQSEKHKRPSPPFTTSTLQQQASHRLHMSAKQTMKLAQDLYEAGHITYMRTDSMNLAEEALRSARTHIESTYGKPYLPESAIRYKTKSRGAQEAHEAIRPTNVSGLPKSVDVATDRHRQLYELIWQRMVSSQMAPARLRAETVMIDAGKGQFKATGNVVVFDGYLKVWPSQREDKILPQLTKGQILELKDLLTEQHFTEPPARYSEATLVKALEEKGIGRPSTYAPTLSTIQDRGYVQLLERRFHPTEVGEKVTELLTEHFPDIVDYDFTAQMEENLDKVAEGKTDWTKLLGDFWKPFEDRVESKTEAVKKIDMTEQLDRVCPKCGTHNLIIRHGRFGKFIACPGFPDCRYTEQIVVKTGVVCPECTQGELIEKKTRKGKTFWGCQRYPDCQYATWNDPRNLKKGSESSDEATEVVDAQPTE